MSLIQDALKRQMDEKAGHAYTPPPVPKSTKTGGGFGKFLGMLLAFVFLLGVAGALFYLATRNWSWKDAMKAAQTDLGKAEQKLGSMRAPVPAKPSNSPSSANPYASVQQRVGKMKSEVAEYNVQTAGAFEEPHSPAQAMQQAKGKAAATTATLAAAADQDEERASGSVNFSGTWPRLTVNGIMSAGSANGAAIINNRMVGAGEVVDSVKVLEVQAKGAVLEYKGESRLVLIGQTTE